MVYCLAPFLGAGTVEDPFRVDGATAIIDLRADASRQAGWALASVPTLPAGAVDLGPTFDHAPTRQTTRSVESNLGLPRDVLAGRTVRRLIEDVLVVYGNLTDPNRWNPPRAELDGRLRIRLDGVVSEVAVAAGGAVDTFDRADAAELGTSSEGTWAWTSGGWDIVSNAAEHTGNVAGRYARADVDVTADHHAQAAVTQLGVKQFCQVGPTARVPTGAATEDDGYVWMIDTDGAGARSVRLRKSVNGSRTDLTSAAAITLTAGDVFRIEADGSTLRGLQNAVEKASVTDTTFGTQAQTGLYGNLVSGAANSRVDDFAADTLTAAALTLGTVTETESSGAFTAASALPLAAVVETEAAQALTAASALPLSSVSETETAGALTVTSAVPLGAAVETETALPLTATSTAALAAAVESEVAGGLGVSSVAGLGVAGETEQAAALTVAAAALTLATAVETETAQPLTVASTLPLTAAGETEPAAALAVTSTLPITTVIEPETAGGLAAASTATLATAVESETGQALQLLGTLTDLRVHVSARRHPAAHASTRPDGTAESREPAGTSAHGRPPATTVSREPAAAHSARRRST